MSIPLTTRAALAAELGEHHFHRPSRRCACGWESWTHDPAPDVWRAHLADALLASGALTDATRLAEDEALVERMVRMILTPATTAEDARLDVTVILTALAATLAPATPERSS